MLLAKAVLEQKGNENMMLLGLLLKAYCKIMDRKHVKFDLP